jgi:isoleucyl-tRNA synthetase
MMANAAPWDNLRFDPAGIEEVTRRFFGTLHNTYSFLALYANIDGFDGSGPEVPLAQRPELDRWILSRLNSLSAEVEQALDSYEPTRAARAIQEFVVDDLSNWHVRLSRRRFWKEADGTDKRSAYATLHTCLRTVAVLASPIAPFAMDRLFRDLEAGVGRATGSVHLATFPTSDASFIDAELEARMGMAQRCVSLALSLRKREKLRVRQPLRRLLVPVADAAMEARWLAVRDVVLSELNIKSLEFLRDGDGNAEVSLVRRAKADFKVLGPRMGTRMKAVAAAVAQLSPEAVSELERTGSVTFDVDGTEETIAVHEVQLTTDDIPGWCVASEYGLTVALDLALDAELKAEGLTRELVNRVQNLRKDRGLEVTDRIALTVEADGPVRAALEQNLDYLRAETLAEEVAWMVVESAENVELVEGTSVKIDLRPL